MQRVSTFIAVLLSNGESAYNIIRAPGCHVAEISGTLSVPFKSWLMRKDFKPNGYNSVSPYLVVNNAQKLIDLLKQILDARELRKYRTPDGRILHAEMKMDDSVIMLADATEAYPQSPTLVHLYVPDADAVYKKAVDAGCQPVQEPQERAGDPDRRGGFRDFAGNFWSVSTQVTGE